jgi:hypothetical protein
MGRWIRLIETKSIVHGVKGAKSRKAYFLMVKSTFSNFL